MNGTEQFFTEIPIFDLVLQRAMTVCVEAHAAQIRKDGITPYWIHPWRVFMYLHVIGVRDRNTMVAALLHDTLEDCIFNLAEMSKRQYPQDYRRAVAVGEDDNKIAIEYLTHNFGPVATQIIIELTNDGSLPKNRRKIVMIEKSMNFSIEARLVKTVDRIDNLRDMDGAFTVAGRDNYLRESRLLLDSLRAGMPQDESGLVKIARWATDQLEKEISCRE